MMSSPTLRGKIEFLVRAREGGEHLITLEFDSVGELTDLLETAHGRGWQPRFFGGGSVNGSQSQTSTNGSTASPPICPIHKVAMHPSKKHSGDWYCSRKTGDSYCTHKVKSG